MRIESSKSGCSRELVSEYYDGGLDETESTAVESHVGECLECREYLNSLKLVSTSLEIMLDDVAPGVPRDFSDRIRTAAETNVNEVGQPLERYRAMVIAAVFAVLSAFVLLFNVGGIGSLASAVGGKIIAFFSFVGHLLYAVVLGFASFAGTVCTNYLFGSTLTVLFVISLVLLAGLVFSKHMRHFIRS